MANTRSLQPGLWNDHWEMPYPFLRRQRITKYPTNITITQATAETLARIQVLRNRIEDLCSKTSRLYGTSVLEELELHEEQRGSNDDEAESSYEDS